MLFVLRRNNIGPDLGPGKNPGPNRGRNPAPPSLPAPYVALRFWPMLFVLRRNSIGSDLYVICSEKK